LSEAPLHSPPHLDSTVQTLGGGLNATQADYADHTDVKHIVGVVASAEISAPQMPDKLLCNVVIV
jgi:hypothetical protein